MAGRRRGEAPLGRTRVCADDRSGGGGDDWYSIATGEAQGARGLSFVVLSTASEAAAVRVTTSTATAAAALVPVPAGGLWGAVVFVADPGYATCDPAVRTPARHQMRIEALDADGAVVSCVGAGVQPSS